MLDTAAWCSSQLLLLSVFSALATAVMDSRVVVWDAADNDAESASPSICSSSVSSNSRQKSKNKRKSKKSTHVKKKRPSKRKARKTTSTDLSSKYTTWKKTPAGYSVHV